MKSSDYWRQRAIAEKKKQLEVSADYEAAMQVRLRRLEHEFEKEALVYLQRYANENNVGLKQAASVLVLPLTVPQRHIFSATMRGSVQLEKPTAFTRALHQLLMDIPTLRRPKTRMAQPRKT